MPGTIPPERPTSSVSGDAPTVARAPVDDEGYIDLQSSAFIESLGPPSQTSEERAAQLVGTLISGRYRADEILGQGGMGAVFSGEQIHLRKRVAIKVLHPDTERLPGLVERFEREAVAGAHVQHPNVASAIDFGKLDDGSYFLVLEYVAGTPLSTLLNEGPFAPARALRIARQMADALAAVHDKGIVHRDVKPQNTLIGPGDQVKIIDFGLAKVDIGSATGQKQTRPEVALTATGMVFGTPAYMAPEAALGMSAVDARSDLYALGVTLYEMLCGRQPFDGSAASLFRKQRLEDPPAMRVRVPNVSVPPEAENLAMRLVQRNPADRYQSAREVMAAIDEALAAVTRKPMPTRSTLRSAPRWAFALTAIGSLALGSAAVVLVRRTSDETNAPAIPVQRTAAPVVKTASPAPPPAAPPPSAPAPSTQAAPTSTASAATPPPSPQPTEGEEADAEALRASLEKANAIRDWVLGAKSFLALAKIDPTAFDDPDTRSRVVAVAAGIAHEGRNELSDAVFTVLGDKLGTRGLDLLYELALSRGGTRGGQRARAILARPDVLDREPPALRIAFEFFVGSCMSRRALLKRAAAEGDRRTLVQLETAHSARCAHKKDPCCFREDPAMAEAITKLRARVEN